MKNLELRLMKQQFYFAAAQKLFFVLNSCSIIYRLISRKTDTSKLCSQYVVKNDDVLHLVVVTFLFVFVFLLLFFLNKALNAQFTSFHS